MIVTINAVGMVQPSIDQIVNMVPMRDRFMATAGAMPMRRLMSACVVLGRATIRIRCGYFDHVFIDTTVMHMMQMALVEIIDVALVSNREMTTARPVDVRMVGRGHDTSFLNC